MPRCSQHWTGDPPRDPATTAGDWQPRGTLNEIHPKRRLCAPRVGGLRLGLLRKLPTECQQPAGQSTWPDEARLDTLTLEFGSRADMTRILV
jgi:hypothetical protein